MWELRRIFSKKMCAFIMILLICNWGLFAYNQLHGSSLTEMKCAKEAYSILLERYRMMDKNDALEQSEVEYSFIKRYKKAVLQKNENSQTEKNIYITVEELLEQTDEDSLSLINMYSAMSEQEQVQFEISLAQMKDKLTYLAGYEDSVQKIIANAENLKRFKLFTKANSFSNSNIIQTSKDFERVADVRVNLDDDRAVDAFVHYYFLYYIAAAIMITIIYAMFTERENGMWQIVHNTKNGRQILAVKRVLIIAIVSFIILIILYVTTAMEAFFIYGGIHDITNPIQTIIGFGKFTYCMSKLQYLGALFILSWIILFEMSVLLWSLFIIFRNRNHTLVLLAVIVGVEILLYQKIEIQSVYSFLHHINIISFLKINELYCSYLNWGMSTYVFSVLSIIIFTISIVAVVVAIAGIYSYENMRPFGKMSMIGRLINRLYNQYQKLLSGYPLVLKEIHKLIFTSKGIWVIIFVGVVSVYFSTTGTYSFTDAQKNKDATYLKYGGADFSEVQAMIDKQIAECESAKEYAAIIKEQYETGQTDKSKYMDANSSMQYEQMELNELEEYREKIDYINHIRESYGKDVWLVSDRGYEEIFGQHSTQRELILLLALVIGIMLIISESISMEYRTGMTSIIRSCKNGRQWINRRKIIACIVFTIGLTSFVYAIDLISMYEIYGIPYLNAPLLSLTFMEKIGGESALWFDIIGKMTIKGWIIVRLVTRLVCALITMIIAIITSKVISKHGNRVVMIIALVLIVISIVFVRGKYGLI